VKSPHADPAAHGSVFGQVRVTIDAGLGDCVVHGVRPGGIIGKPFRMRLNSVDEIMGAYQVQRGNAGADPLAADIASALKFAIQQIKPKSSEA
jgi:hypothetical protein